MKEDDTFLSNGRVQIKEQISEDPKSWSNGRAQRKK